MPDKSKNLTEETVYKPSRATIRRECAKIREGWDDMEYRRRLTNLTTIELKALDADVHVIKTADIDLNQV